ncbi:hypothetical protein J7K93_02810 [bacterium]|nr:hypothetical protein [bacterium]
MGPLILTIIFSLFYFLPAFSQQVEVFGYFEPQLMLAKIGNDFYQLSSNKLRVDLQLKASDNVSFGANFNYITYHGKTKWDILKFLPESVAAEAPTLNLFGYETNPYIMPYKNRNFLDNAFVKLSFKYADFTIGKQQLSIGTGYAWNPTDVFNKKDVIDPTYEQPGHNAFRMDLPIKGDFGITAIYAPTEDWHDTDILVKLKGRFSHFDFSFLGSQKHWAYTDARIVDPIAMNFYKMNTKRHILGADFAGELFGFGVWGEYAYNKVKIDDQEKQTYLDAFSPLLAVSSYPYQSMEIKQDYYELVMGFDYTFDFQTYIMCEYYRNTSAKSDYKHYNFNDWMQYLSAETKSITRDQVYIFVQHPLTDLINISTSCIISLSDNSSAVIPMVTYNVFENVDLSLFVNYYFGKEGTAYAGNLGNGGIFRARVYF